MHDADIPNAIPNPLDTLIKLYELKERLNNDECPPETIEHLKTIFNDNNHHPMEEYLQSRIHSDAETLNPIRTLYEEIHADICAEII